MARTKCVVSDVRIRSIRDSFKETSSNQIALYVQRKHMNIRDSLNCPVLWIVGDTTEKKKAGRAREVDRVGPFRADISTNFRPRLLLKKRRDNLLKSTIIAYTICKTLHGHEDRYSGSFTRRGNSHNVTRLYSLDVVFSITSQRLILKNADTNHRILFSRNTECQILYMATKIDTVDHSGVAK